MKPLKIQLFIIFFMLIKLTGTCEEAIVSNELDSLTIFQINLSLQQREQLSNKASSSILFDINQPVYVMKNGRFLTQKPKKKKRWGDLILHLGGGAVIGALTGYSIGKFGPETEDPSNEQLARIYAPITGIIGLVVGGAVFALKTNE